MQLTIVTALSDVLRDFKQTATGNMASTLPCTWSKQRFCLVLVALSPFIIILFFTYDFVINSGYMGVTFIVPTRY